jgi:uncharacterized Fe-S radical SAM superfamily protein PflX
MTGSRTTTSSVSWSTSSACWICPPSTRADARTGEALPHALEAGFRLPIVYNTSSYDSHRRVEGIVDIYMPDFKLWTNEAARRFLRKPDYPDIARLTVKEMARQVGPLVFRRDRAGPAV